MKIILFNYINFAGIFQKKSLSLRKMMLSILSLTLIARTAEGDFIKFVFSIWIRFLDRKFD